MKAMPWILGNVKDNEELKNKIIRNWRYFYYVHKVSQIWLWHHLVITDKKGNNEVIEFENKKIVIKDNPIEVLTNSSPLEWHYKHLRSYSNLS